MDDIKLPDFQDLDATEDLDAEGLFDDLLQDIPPAPSSPAQSPSQNFTDQDDLFADIVADVQPVSMPVQHGGIPAQPKENDGFFSSIKKTAQTFDNQARKAAVGLGLGQFERGTKPQQHYDLTTVEPESRSAYMDKAAGLLDMIDEESDEAQRERMLNHWGISTIPEDRRDRRQYALAVKIANSETPNSPEAKERQKKIDVMIDMIRDENAEIQKQNPVNEKYSPAWIASGVTNMVGQMLPAMLAGVPFGPGASASIFAGQSVGGEYAQARADGYGEDKAGEIANIKGGAEAAGEMVGGGAVVEAVKKVASPVIKRILEAAGINAAEEQVTEIVNQMYESAALGREVEIPEEISSLDVSDGEKKFLAYLDGQGQAATIGAFGGGVTTGAGAGINTLAQSLVDKKPAAGAEEFTGGLGLRGLASRKLNPEQIKNINMAMTSPHDGGASSAAKSFEEALSGGAAISDAYAAFGYGFGIGSTQSLPIARFFDQLDKASGGGVKRLLMDVANQPAEAGLQGDSQRVLSKLVAGGALKFDEKRGTLSGVGGAFNGAANAVPAMEFIGEMLTGFRRLRHRDTGQPLSHEEIQIQAKGVSGNIAEIQSRLASAEKSMAAVQKRYQQAAKAGATTEELQQFEDNLSELEGEVGALKSQYSSLREQGKSLDLEAEAAIDADIQASAQQLPAGPQWSETAENDLQDAFKQGLLEQPGATTDAITSAADAAVPSAKVETPEIEIPDLESYDIFGDIEEKSDVTETSATSPSPEIKIPDLDAFLPQEPASQPAADKKPVEKAKPAMDTDVISASGKPFSTRRQAESSLKQRRNKDLPGEWDVVEVVGGFAIRPPGNKNKPEPENNSASAGGQNDLFGTKQKQPAAEAQPEQIKPARKDDVISAFTGKPFSSRKVAESSLKQRRDKDLKGDWSVVEVEGGFAIRRADAQVADKKAIDSAAHEAATSPKNNLPHPTEAQKDAGNYKKGHITLQGLDIAIENPKGSVRSGISEDGKFWENKLHSHYGYIKKTEGADGDHVDVFVGEHPESEWVFIVDQVNADRKFDEHKVMLGFPNKLAAINGYKDNYEKDWRVGPVSKLSMDEFKEWLKGDTTKPYNKHLAASTKIEDLGEKIGGARKDTSTSTGQRGKRTAEADMPTWRKRFAIAQNVLNKDGEYSPGNWEVFDKKTGKKVRGAGSFATEAEAENALPLIAVGVKHRVVPARTGDKYHIYRDVTDRKRVRVVKEEFDTRMDAMKYMAEHASEILELKTSFGEEILPTPEKVYRSGVKHREGDVSGQDFIGAFGFRGVEFGNWNNQAERQEVMNHAYDALMDMAGVLGVPPKALSLNGELALAFGARGQGLSGAKAHYEIEYGVINLTKMSGAGSLAHEWFHGLDHYLSRLDGTSPSDKVDAARGGKAYKYGTFFSHGFNRRPGARQELRAAYETLIKSMFQKAEQYVEDTQKADKFVAATRESLVNTINGIRNELAAQKDIKYYKRHNKPASAEQLAEFDSLAAQLVDGQNLKTEWRANNPDISVRDRGALSGRHSNDVLDKMSVIFKAVRGRAGFNAERTGALDKLRGEMSRYAQRIEMLESAKSSETKTKNVPTSFAMEAREADQGRASDYWTTPHEMAARAFAAYVEDKITEQGGNSQFLVYHAHGVALAPTEKGYFYPYPEGKERLAVNAAFDKFFETLESVETDKGVQLREEKSDYEISDAGGKPYAAEQREWQGDLFSTAHLPKHEAELQRVANARVRVHHVATGTIKVGLEEVKTPEDAAHIFAAMRKHAQENMLVLVTDEGGKVLALQRYSKGIKDAATINPGEVAAAAAAVAPGKAKQIWFSHNHPSGVTTPSNADRMVTKSMQNAMGWSNEIVYRGHIVIGQSGKAELLEPDGGSRPITPRPAVRNQEIELTERMYAINSVSRATSIDTPAVAKEFMASLPGESGALLLDNRNRAIGYLEIPASIVSSNSIKSSSLGNEILRAIDQTNASAVMMRGKHDTDFAAGIAKIFESLQVRALDYVTDSGMSYAEKGLMENLPVYKRMGGKAGAGVTADEAQRVIQKFRAQYQGAGDLKFYLFGSKEEAYGRENLRKAGIGDNQKLKGAYEAGSVHLILEDHADAADLLATIRHEVWTHHGLSMLSEADRKRVLFSTEIARAGNQELRDLWTQIKQDYKDADYQVRSEELIARIAELYGDVIHDKAQSRLKTAIDKIFNILAEVLRKIGFLGPKDGVDQLIDILVDVAARMRKPQKAADAETESRGLLFNQNDRLAITTERLKQYPSASLFTAIAKHGENFRYQKSDAKTYEEIFKSILPGLDARASIKPVVSPNTESKAEYGAEPTQKVEIVNDGVVTASIKQWRIKGTNKHFVEIDSLPGTDGMALYQAAFTWAHNNGQVLVPDPSGVSDMNLLRRMEAAISSALRFGTTRHFQNQPESYMALLPEHQYDALDPMSTRQKLFDKDGNLTAYAQSKEGNEAGIKAKEALEAKYREVWKDESKIDKSDKKAVDIYFHNLQNMVTASQNLVMQRSEKVRDYANQRARENAGRAAQSFDELSGWSAGELEKVPLNLTEKDYRAGVGLLAARRAIGSEAIERLAKQSASIWELESYLQRVSPSDAQHAPAELRVSDQRHLLSADKILSQAGDEASKVASRRERPLFYRLDGDQPVVIATGAGDGPGMRFKQLRSALHPQVRAASAQGVDVQVIADIAGLPDGVEVDPKAAVIRHGKTLYLVASNISRPSDVRRLIEKSAKRMASGKETDTHADILESVNKAIRSVPTLEELKGGRVAEAMKRPLMALAARRHLADFGSKYVPGIRRYVSLAQRMDADRNDLLASSAEMAERWRDYLKREPVAAQKLAELMHDTTIAGVDPSKKYQPLTTPEETKELIERERRLIRSNNAEENQKRFANIEKFKMTLAQEKNREKARADIQTAWNALPAEAKALYEQVRDSYVVRRKMMFDALEDRIKDSIANEKSRKELIDKLRKQFESNTVQEPYFPLQRFGQYWVRVKGAKDEDGNFSTEEFTMFETEGDWKKYVDHLRSQGLNVAAGKKIEKMVGQTGVDPSFVVDVDNTLSKLHGPQIDQLRDQIYQLYLNTLPDLTVRKHFIHRKKTEGFSEDAIRAYAHNMFHGGHQLARLRWGYKLERIMEQMGEAVELASDDDKLEEYRKEVEAGTGNPIVLRDAETAQRDLSYASDLVSEMHTRHQWAMNPQGGWFANKATTIGFAWYLGLTPAAALVNTTQVPLVAYPMLGAKFGFGPAAVELQRAYKDYFKGGAGKDGFFSMSKSLEGEELDAYHRFVRDGVIDKTLAHDLAGLSEEGSQYSDKMHRFMKVVSWGFHKAEVSNREIVAMATYRLARQKGFNHEKAMRQASEITWDSQFDYSSGNKARVMQSDTAKILLMFKQYSLNMTYLLYRTAKVAINQVKFTTEEEKSEARRRMAALLGMHWMFAGVLGILPQPIFPAIEKLLESLLGDDDEPFDLEAEIRVLAAEIFGKQGGAIATKGVVNAVTGADIAGRISLSELLIRSPDKDLEGEDLYSHVVEQLLGPGPAIIGNAFAGGALVMEGYTVRGIEKALPKAFRDVLKTGRFAAEGVQSMRGDPIIEEASPLQLMWQVLGFTPAQLAERYDENAVVKRAEKRILDRRRALVDRYALAFRVGDVELRKETVEAIKHYNEVNREYPIDGGTLMKSLQSRAKYSQRATQGVIVNPHLVKKMERYDFAE